MKTFLAHIFLPKLFLLLDTSFLDERWIIADIFILGLNKIFIVYITMNYYYGVTAL